MTIPGVSWTKCATPRWWVVATSNVPRSMKWLRIAVASAEPSSGSVLVPSSSTNTREWTVALPMMFSRLDMWELKVDRACSMLCWSPISA